MIKCDECSFQNTILANFCGGCGRAIADPQSDSGDARGDQRLSSELRHNIYQSRTLAQGSIRHVTVMFADIRSSMELIQNFDPEAERELLSGVVSLMMASVHRYDGIVSQVLGDGIMALFGALKPDEDHATLACYAALDMHEAMKDGLAVLEKDLGVKPQIRVGLNSGSVVIEMVSNDLGIDYRALGSPVHMASRLEQLAMPDTTRISEDTLKLAQGYIETTPMGQSLIKGITSPVETYELLGRTRLNRFQAQITRGLSPFTGRENEIRAIWEIFQSVGTGDQVSLLVSGETGIGKSRLVFEVLKDLPTEDFAIFQMDGLAHLSPPFNSLRGMLQFRLELIATDLSDHALSRLQKYLLAHGELGEFEAELRSLLDLPTEDETWLNLDPPMRRIRMLEAMAHLVEVVAAGRKIVVVCEDFQWFDQESALFLTHLFDNIPAQGLVVIATQRERWSESESGVRFQDELELSSLPKEHAGEFLRNILGDDQEASAIHSRIIDRSQGNPLFIEEIVRSMVETGVLVGEAGANKIENPQFIPEIPPSVELVISARLDRLDPSLQELLTAAAIISDEITTELLSGLLEIPEVAVGLLLEQVVEAGMLVAKQQLPRRSYRFRHTNTRDVIYASLLKLTKAEFHARLVTVYEKIFQGDLDDKVDQLAIHSYIGRLWEKSARYNLSASIKATTRSANRYAWMAISKGLESLEKLSAAGTQVPELEIDLRLAGMGPLTATGEFGKIFKLIAEAEQIGKTNNITSRLGAVYSQSATYYWLAGKYDQALQAAEKGLTIANENHDHGLRMRTEYNLALIHHAFGNFQQSVDLLHGLIERIPEDAKRKRYGWIGNPSVFCLIFLGSSLAFQGRFAEATIRFQEGIDLADEVAHPYSQTLIREELGYLHLMMGEPELAFTVLEEARRLCENNDVSIMKAPLAARLAEALCGIGEVKKAEELITDAFARKLYRNAGTYALDYMYLALAQVQRKLQQVDAALESAKKGEEITRQSKQHAHNVLALIELGECYLESDAVDDAERVISRASAKAQELGMQPLVARCNYLLGRLKTGRNRDEEAAKDLAKAGLEFKTLGMKSLAKQCLELQESLQTLP